MSSRRRFVALVSAVVLVAAGCSGGGDDPATTTAGSSASGIPALTYEIVSRSPHDTAAFTEGFTFGDDGRLFESLGLEGNSSVREVDPTTGAVLGESRLDPAQFGEGLAVGPDGLVQLTWKDGVAHRWSVDDLTPSGVFDYEGEGWGLTFDGEEFVQSDGSPTLTRRDATTFEPTATVEVTRGGDPVEEINELEWVDGVIWANVWHSDEILRIDPSTGHVTGVIDASALWEAPERTAEMTLNGIAHRPGDPPNRLWLTGKNWPEMFEVEVTER
jgi:glutamine cyclotransferase